MSKPAFVENNRTLKWFDDRLPVVSYLHHHTVEYPTPKNLNYFWNFGSLALFMLVFMIATGIFLAMHYVPHEDHAFASVEGIMRDVNYGWLIRYMHMNGASFFFLVVYIHIFRGLYYGSYKAPREVLWWLGVVILFLMIITAFLGYSLPWGQMSFWAATVITSLATAVPIIGEDLVVWLWGGFSVDNPTLKRFYALHYLLPFVIFGLSFMHLWALHTVKSNNPLGIDPKGEQDTIPFHPYFTIKDLFGVGVLMIVFSAVVFYAPNYLAHADNYIPADPLVTPAHIVPEWYFLPFYAILRAVPDKLGGVVLMAASILILMVLPWLDSCKVRSARFRPLFKQFFWLFTANVIFLGYVGAQPAEGIWVPLAQVSTAYYFAHFLIVLPLLSKYEKTKPLPVSISQPVLKEGAAHA